MAHFHGATAGVHLHGNGESQAAGGAAPTAPTTVAGAPTGSTTYTVTWVDASSDETGFQVQIRTADVGAGPGAWADAVGDTNPTAAGVQTFAGTGATATTLYDVRVRALGASADSAYVESAAPFVTDNPGSGGGTIPQILDGATLGAVAAGGTLSGNPAAFGAGATLGAVSAGGALGPGSAFASGAALGALLAGGTLVGNPAAFGAGATLRALAAGGTLQSVLSAFGAGATLAGVQAGGALSSNPSAFGAGALLGALLAGGALGSNVSAFGAGAALGALLAGGALSGVPAPSAARTYTIYAAPAVPNPVNADTVLVPTYVHDLDAHLDYTWAWAPWLADVADAVQTLALELDPGITETLRHQVGSSISLWVQIAGLVAGNTPRIRCRITTVAGRVDDRTIQLQLVQH